MTTLLQYNFDPANLDLLNQRWADFFKHRRDSFFAGVYQANDTIYAVRDHLGIVPLFYCQVNGQYHFATSWSPLLPLIDKPIANQRGLRAYLGLQTVKVLSPIQQIKIIPPGSVYRLTAQGETCLYQYPVTPKPTPQWRSLDQITDEFEALLVQALKRQIKGDTAGLYLSGGIDSGLIGLYLKRLGLKLHSFSSATGGTASSELPFIDENLKHIKPAASSIDYLTDDYLTFAKQLPDLYRLPAGNPTALAVSSLWRQTPIAEQTQIFFGQNCDVIMSAMDNHHLLTFLKPKSLESRIADYLEQETGGLVNFPIMAANWRQHSQLNALQLTALAGMTLTRTPTDGETLAQPAINAGIILGNPYYDMDLVEFCLGLRLNHRLCFGAPNSRHWISLDKKVLRHLAKRQGYSDTLVYRKKGFTVAQGRRPDEPAGRARYFANLPNNLCGLPCSHPSQRHAAETFNRYLEAAGQKIDEICREAD